MPPTAVIPTKGDQALADTKIKVPPLGGAYLNAVSSVPVKDFGIPKPIIKVAPLALAQTLITSDPVSVTSLPVKTPRTITDNGSGVASNTMTVLPRGRDSSTAPLSARWRSPVGDGGRGWARRLARRRLSCRW